MMKERLSSPFSILFSLLNVVFKRIRHNLGLSISALLGIVAVMSIIVAVPVFSHAVSSKVLRNQLEEKAAIAQRRLLSQHVYNIDTTGSMTLKNVDFVSEVIRERFPRLMNLEIEEIISEVQSTSYPWEAVEPPRKVSNGEPWIDMGFVTSETVSENGEIVEGDWPEPAFDLSTPIQTAVTEDAADEYYLKVGDRFRSGDLEVEITGIWRPKNLSSSNWFESPDVAYKNKLWVPKETYQNTLQSALEKPVFYSSWHIIVDETGLDFTRAAQYARGLVRIDF